MAKLKFGKACFRSSRDIHNPSNFHSKCDEIKPTITVIKTIKGLIFGGVYQTWKGYGYKTDESAFVFSVNLKKKYPNVIGTSAIYTSSSPFPCFGTLDINMTKFKLCQSVF